MEDLFGKRHISTKRGGGYRNYFTVIAFMKHEILKYLLEHKFDKEANFAKFLCDTFPTLTREQVRDTLSILWRDELIAGPHDGLIRLFMPREHLGKPMADFPGDIVGWKITTAGERQYFDDEFRNQVTRLNAVSIQANKSSIETNKSIRSLNSFQKWVSTATAFVAVASFVAIYYSAKYAKAGVTSADVQALTQQIKKNTTILDSVRRYEKGIDSSLRKITSDTSPRKSR
jgi:hypothetical protein